MWETICNLILSLLICGIAVERITEVIHAGEIFSPLRLWLGAQAFKNPIKPSKFWVWIQKLLTCAYCLSHWVAALLVWVLPGNYFELELLNNAFVKWMALVGVANLYHAAFNLVHRGRVLTVDMELKHGPIELPGPSEVEYEPGAHEPVEGESDGIH